MSQSGKPTRSFGDIWNALFTPDSQRPEYTGSVDPETGEVNLNRDLNHVYLYGNTKQHLLPFKGNIGVNYDQYLQKHGRDPKNVAQYEGIIQHAENDFTFPTYAQSYIENLANSHLAKSVGYNGYDTYGDNVAGHLGKVDLNREGIPAIVMSDLWDFGKGYGKKWGGGLQAKMLDKVGTPFILKDDKSNIIKYSDDKQFTMTPQKAEIMLQAGIIPEITVTPSPFSIGKKTDAAKISIHGINPLSLNQGGTLNYFDYFK